MCIKRFSLAESSQDLIKALCRSEPSERLPLKKGGTRNLKTFLACTSILLLLLSLLLPSVALWQSCAFISICMLDFLPRHAFYKNFDWNAFETLKWQPEMERMWGDVSRCCGYILSSELKWAQKVGFHDHGMVLQDMPS